MLMIVMMMKVELIKWIVMQNVMAVFEEELLEIAQIVFIVEIEIGLKVVNILELVRRQSTQMHQSAVGRIGSHFSYFDI